LTVASGVDVARAQAAVRELPLAIGEDPQREGLRDTPARLARAYEEIFAGHYIDPADILETPFEEGHDELALVKDIPLYSVCEHHLVPWHGSAAVGYVPGPTGRVVGLSKVARLVDLYAKRLQLQERLTAEVADAVQRRLAATGAIVVVRGQHLCMAMRGIQKPGSITVTSAVRGVFKTDSCARDEAMTLILRR
jgi:GTP cyclohydrolase IA